MLIFVVALGILVGYILNNVIKTFCKEIAGDNTNTKSSKINLYVIITTALLFFLSFHLTGFNVAYLKNIVLISILVVVSFVDLKHQIIPDKMIVVTLILGGAFVFVGEVSVLSAILGMFIGGGTLFLMALVPNALGGGDIKLMFAVGLFLGVTNTLYAIFLAFILAAFISVILLLFRLKGRKDHIPFGPFLAMGSLIAFLIL